MKSSMWEPATGIVGPCAAIAFTMSRENHVLTVTMHFSLVDGLPNKDLKLRFGGVLAVNWEVECPGFFPFPRDMPKCPEPQWARWTFPLLRVEGSELREQFRGIYEVGGGPKLAHFLLLSMDDILHVVARDSAVSTEWIAGVAEGQNA